MVLLSGIAKLRTQAGVILRRTHKLVLLLKT
jgi:hypothetical protein